MSYLEVNSLTVRYGQFAALDNITLGLEKGELLAVVGPSGSGKSTLLLSVAGFTPITSGTLLRDQKALTPVPPHRRDIGIVFQSFALFPHLSVFGNIAYPLRLRHWTKDSVRIRVTSLLQKLHLTDLANRLPNELSGGQQQRVALARALSFQPELLLMDEPLGALDRELREELQFEIRRIQQDEHLTILYVTHDQHEAMSIADRIAVLSKGKIEQVGTPKDIYMSPLTPFVARFFGGANFLQGVVEIVGNDSQVVAIRNRKVQAQLRPTPVDIGTRVAVMFRPRDTHIVRGGTDGIPCKVIRISYLGEYTSVELEAREMHSIDGTNTILRAVVGESPDLAPGDEVTAVPDFSRTLVFPLTEVSTNEHSV